MLDILTVVHYPVFGGPHNQALRLDAAFRARGIHQTVLVPDEPGNAAERLRQGGVDVVTMPLSRLRASPDPRLQVGLAAGFAPQVGAIRRLIRARRIDLVAIGGLVNPHAAIAARLEGVPVVWQLLDTRPPPMLRRALMPLVTRLSDAIMSTGSGVARVHPGACSLGKRLVPFFPPVDCDAFRPVPPMRADVRGEWGIDASAPVVGCVGNINPQKGIEWLVAAFARFRAGTPEARLVLVGAEYATHTGYSAALRSQIRDLGLREGRDVIFAGGRSDIERQLQGFDLFVLSSVPNSEGVPTAILEAMACGVPVVATDVGAVREVVEDGVTGFVVPPLDPEAIAAAALRILGDDDLRLRMSREGRRRAVERYDVEVCAETHVRAFEAALAHRRWGKKLAVTAVRPSSAREGGRAADRRDDEPATQHEAGAGSRPAAPARTRHRPAPAATAVDESRSA